MWSRHFRYAASIMLIVLAISLAVAAIALIYILLVKPEPFFITFSNLLFFPGMIVLTIGAFFEFFLRARSPQIGRSLLTPIDYLIRRSAFEEVAKDKAKQGEYEPSGGWMLIYAGALMILISLLSAFVGMK